jgi:hypothetical protein
MGRYLKFAPDEINEWLETRGVIAYNLGKLRRLALPLTIQSWRLTSLQQRSSRPAGRLIGHARYFTRQLAKSYLTRPLFRQIVAQIYRGPQGKGGARGGSISGPVVAQGGPAEVGRQPSGRRGSGPRDAVPTPETSFRRVRVPFRNASERGLAGQIADPV